MILTTISTILIIIISLCESYIISKKNNEIKNKDIQINNLRELVKKLGKQENIWNVENLDN